MSTHPHLFAPATVGHLALPSRFVMAPVTRNRPAHRQRCTTLSALRPG
jgi:2,4-dienoyl-CoA reductase-like NADH-dependent reductase (Old Yellow Enzyme family)